MTYVLAGTTLFSSKEQYAAFTQRWKELANAKALLREDFLLRSILLKRDPLKALSPTRDLDRLANGGRQGSGLFLALTQVCKANPQYCLKNRNRQAERGFDPWPAAWYERWVQLGQPASLASGLDLATLERVLAHAKSQTAPGLAELLGRAKKYQQCYESSAGIHE
jgi:hypothetical protein